MRRITLSLALLACAGLQAQELTPHDFQNYLFVDDFGDGYTEEYIASGVVNHVSANGQYAVGYDTERLMSNTGGSFLWKHSDPSKLFQLSTSQNRMSACDVSNDGIIVGSFEVRTDPEKKEVAYPGFRHINDTEWTQLPVPEEYSKYFARSSNLTEEARAITPDGKYIAGNFHYKIGEKDVLGTIVDQAIVPVTVWEKDGDSYIMQNCYTELGKAGNNMRYIDGELVVVEKDVNYKEFLVRDISNDGQTVIGMNVSWRGGFNPAFVRDGKLVQLFYCGEENEPDEDANFNGGTLLSIDAQGNMYGYFADQEGMLTSFVYTNEGKIEYLDDNIVCADKDGNRFDAYYGNLMPVADCSEDGKVVVGAGVGDAGYGVYNYPKLLSDDTTVGIASAQTGKNDLKVAIEGGNLNISGAWMYANIYNLSGQLLEGGSRGTIFNMNTLPTGTYLVKVLTATGVKTFKVAK